MKFIYDPHRLFNKHFLLLFQGQLVSQIGTSIYLVGLIFWLKQATHSATVIGLLYMVAMIPAVLLGPLGGTIADRYSRKTIIVMADMINGSLMISVATVMLLRPEATELIITLLFITVFSGGLLHAFFQPAINAAIPDLVPQPKIEAANGLLQSSVQVSLLIGQSLGGLLFVILGAPVLMLINGISFLLSALSECFITIPQKKAIEVKGWGETLGIFKEETLEGFHYIRDKPGLLNLFLVMAVTSFFIAPFGVLLPFFVEDTLQSTPEWYGFLMAGLGFGLLLGSTLAAVLRVPPVIKGKLVVSALLLFSLGLGGVGYSTTVMAALLILVSMGVCSGFMQVLINSVIQRSTPSAIRGRVFGLLATVSMALMPISMGLSGVIADLVNHNIALMYTGCGICSMVVTLFLLFSDGFHQLLSMEGDYANKNLDTFSL